MMKSAKISGQLLLRDSKDDLVSGSNIKLKCGKFDVSNKVYEAESALEFQKILGYHQTSTAGFGSIRIPEIPPKRTHEYRKTYSLLLVNRTNKNFMPKPFN